MACLVAVAQASDGLALDADLDVTAAPPGQRLRPPVSEWPVPGVSGTAHPVPEPGSAWLSGMASIYSQRFHGRPTASGEPYLSDGWTAAHRDLPLGTLLSVRNPANGTEVVVRVNDRGPFHANRLVDLSMAAAQHLGLLRQGVAVVVIRPLSADQADRRALGPQPVGVQLVAADALGDPPDAPQARAGQGRASTRVRQRAVPRHRATLPKQGRPSPRAPRPVKR
jgi:rare lipoprotein A